MKPRPKRWRMIATMRLRNGLPHRMVLASTIAIPSSVACFEKSSVEPDSVRRSETDASPAVLRVLVVSDPILPAQLTGGLTFVALTAGWRHTCGLTSSGRAYCWGDYDVFFAGANGHAPRPVADNLAFVSLSGGAAASHTCGVTAANVAYCWGHKTACWETAPRRTPCCQCASQEDSRSPRSSREQSMAAVSPRRVYCIAGAATVQDSLAQASRQPAAWCQFELRDSDKGAETVIKA